MLLKHSTIINNRITKKDKKECVKICAKFCQNHGNFSTKDFPEFEKRLPETFIPHTILSPKTEYSYSKRKTIYKTEVTRVTRLSFQKDYFSHPTLEIGKTTIRLNGDMSTQDKWIINELLETKVGKEFISSIIKQVKETYGELKQAVDQLETNLTPFTLLDECF